MIDMIYQKKLEELRIENNITQYTISEYLELNKRVYGQYEREYVIMPLKHLNKICNYFNVSLDYIFGFTNQKQYYNSNKEINSKVVGQRLKDFRKNNNLTQENLAFQLKTTFSVISGYETGRRLIATPFLYTICKKYKISADYLLGKIDDKIIFDK